MGPLSLVSTSRGPRPEGLADPTRASHGAKSTWGPSLSPGRKARWKPPLLLAHPSPDNTLFCGQNLRGAKGPTSS